MNKIFYISNALPNSMTSGSDVVAFNILKELKKKYEVHAISINSNYCKKDELIKIHNELKQKKIKYHEINQKILVKKKGLTLFNFFKKNYINTNEIFKAQKFISKINIDKNDIILAFGSSAIFASKNINCLKIALFEDLQEQIHIYRTLLSFNKFNFIKKTLKLIMLKIHFRGYNNWLKKISVNHQIKYTFSPFDFNCLKNKINLKVLPLPWHSPVYKQKKQGKKLFNISMFSTTITQDFNGVTMLYNHLIPKLKNENLLNKVKINLIMRVPKNIPKKIKKIINDKNIYVCEYNEKIIKSTDLLFYPSKYPVGIRTKILFAFSRYWLVATSSVIKKCIPELRDLKNCVLSNNIDILSQKIIEIIKNPKRYDYLKLNGFKVLKQYSIENFSKVITKDINKIIRVND